MTTYQVEYPDLEASSAPEIASMASFFNRSAMALAQNEGWALFFDVKRYKTKDYPAGNFSNLAGWLIDQRRAENYHKFGEHFTTEYYITFVYQLSSDIDSKTTGFFFKNKKKNKKYKNKEVKVTIFLRCKRKPRTFLITISATWMFRTHSLSKSGITTLQSWESWIFQTRLIPQSLTL